MTKRRTLWLVAALVVLAALAVLIPGSPAHLPTLMGGGYFGQYHDGHSAGYWRDGLKSPDAEARRRAIFALGAIGPDAGEAVPALAVILREDPDAEARQQAALALSKMAPASRAAVPALAEALADEEPFVRMNAALALSRLRAEARPAVPALIEALKDEDNRTNVGRFAATIAEAVALALGRASAGSADAVPALTEALAAARTVGMREARARALGEVGAEARPAVPQLQALLQDKNVDVRWAAEDALRKIEGEPGAK